MKKQRRKNKNKRTWKQRVSIVMYIISAFLILMMIPHASDFFASIDGKNQDSSSVSLGRIQYDFMTGDYVSLIDHTSNNIALDVNITDEAEPYYAFAACYDSAVDYHMYMVSGQTEQAQEQLSIFNDNKAKLSKKIFTDKLKKMQVTYDVP